ncbi:probable protein phosphatase 2C 77 [Phragmites australis]|uniref:probable protein phosphatase 2C 77 n=1 Tax=Phragmites australis TaxID=29695 RepID=UPI002D78C4E5|nr:probable protein phosphatase 2C 77 [Phragmites australis]
MLQCSVVVAFARLAHVLSRALKSLCSPTSAAMTTVIPPAWLPPGRSKKVDPVALVDDKPGRKDQLQLLALPPALPAFNGESTAEEKKTAKAARGRPPRLVIPPQPACAAAVDPFGEAAGRETDVATEVEVQGEGFCLASRRGVRHAMEDGYEVITDNNIGGGGSQLAFYGVYDGHGGRAAVDLVADKLGKNVIAALAASSRQQSEPSSSSSSSMQQGEEDEEEQQVNAVMAAIRSAYLTTDSELLSQGIRGGACAATALVKDGELYVANVGDCRAVLGSCHGGVATALTTDHTAGREDERRRIESSGGYVSRGSSGVWRVQDCLAVSRAFGDVSMKPWVTCEPEVSRRRLTPDCRFLLVASDGLWDKVSSQEAVDVISAAWTGTPVGSCKDLVAMAKSRGSRDDITVMVVDLQRFLR